MNQPAEKEQLQARLKLLDSLLIAFGALVAIGLIGEELRLPRFDGAVTIGVTAEALLTFLHVRKSRRLESLQELEIESIKFNAAEANRLAEQDRLARVKIEERLAPRCITESERVKLIAELKRFAPRLVDVLRYPDDAEVTELTRQLVNVLKDSGWKPTMQTVTNSAEPICGIIVEVDGKNPGNIAAGEALVSGFSAVGLNPKELNSFLQTPLVGAAVRITVGRK